MTWFQQSYCCMQIYEGFFWWKCACCTKITVSFWRVSILNGANKAPFHATPKSVDSWNMQVIAAAKLGLSQQHREVLQSYMWLAVPFVVHIQDCGWVRMLQSPLKIFGQPAIHRRLLGLWWPLAKKPAVSNGVLGVGTLPYLAHHGKHKYVATASNQCRLDVGRTRSCRDKTR